MTLLFYALSVLAVLAIAATVFALVSARDGYEDQAGFHPAEPERPPPPTTVSSVSKPDQGKASVHSFLSDPLNPHFGC